MRERETEETERKNFNSFSPLPSLPHPPLLQLPLSLSLSLYILTRPERKIHEPVRPELPQPLEPPRPQVLPKLERKPGRRVGPLGRLGSQVEARPRLEQQEGLVAVVARAAELEEDSLELVGVWWVWLVGGGRGWEKGCGERERETRDAAPASRRASARATRAGAAQTPHCSILF